MTFTGRQWGEGGVFMPGVRHVDQLAALEASKQVFSCPELESV